MEANRRGMLTVGAVVAVAITGAAVALMARSDSVPAAAVLGQAPEVTVYKTPT